MEASWVGKVGGSLFEPPDLPDLGERLQSVLVERGGPRPLLIVGGGPTVELIRRWDRLYELGEEFSHWLAVRALSVNGRIVERILSAGVITENDSAIQQAWAHGQVPIVDCYRFLKDVDEKRIQPLARRWKVTSDSIAARLAEQYEAPELALLKSTTVADGMKVAQAAAEGVVDPYFPTAASHLGAVVLMNLRQRPPPMSCLAT